MREPKTPVQFVTDTRNMHFIAPKLVSANPRTGVLHLKYGMLGDWKAMPKNGYYSLMRIVPSKAKATKLELKLQEAGIRYSCRDYISNV